jgi:hypothetical protein
MEFDQVTNQYLFSDRYIKMITLLLMFTFVINNHSRLKKKKRQNVEI